MEKHYPAKLLLFGEYSIINNSLALAIPYQKFYGKWAKSKDSDTNEKSMASSSALWGILDYLVARNSDFFFLRSR